MRLYNFKNTLLFQIILGIVFVMVSCGNQTKKNIVDNDEMFRQAQYDTLQTAKIIVGANQTEKYLPLLKGKRIGIVANQTSVIFKNEVIATTSSKSHNDANTHLVDSLLSLKINVTSVFSPEHGFRGTADAGEEVEDGKDAKTGLPILSLHGKNRKPTQAQLKDIDIMIFDVQDVGVRFYTYISTLHYIMEACAEANIPVIILDRPNPNGSYIDGPTLEIENKSFLGMHPIPLVHGMTIGEYAQMINGEHWLTGGVQCTIAVIPVKNYTHDAFYRLPIRPSPNLPSDQAIKLYPSLGLFEGTNINAGRGTEFQFQRYGAPFLDKNFFTFSYTPIENFGAKTPKHKDVLCYGEDLVKDSLYGEVTVKWIIKAYEHATDKSLVFNTANFTKHAGTNKLQKQIEAGLSEVEIKATWQTGIANFKRTRSKYLIYD